MIHLNLIFPLMACVMIAALGGWIAYERHQRRHALKIAEREREKIRTIAEDAVSKATSCVAVIELIDLAPQQLQRRLQVVRDDQNGISRWEWQ